MARIPYPDPETLDPEDARFLSDLPDINAFRLLSACPPLFKPMIQFFSAYLTEGQLDKQIRELAILRVGHLCHSAYELTQHERAARVFGLDDRRIAATALDGDLSVYSEKEKAVIAYVDDVVKNTGASKSTFDTLSQYFSHSDLIELTLFIGIYVMWCQLFESFELDIEDTPVAETAIDDVKRSVDKLS